MLVDGQQKQIREEGRRYNHNLGDGGGKGNYRETRTKSYACLLSGSGIMVHTSMNSELRTLTFEQKKNDELNT